VLPPDVVASVAGLSDDVGVPLTGFVIGSSAPK
jgi:hypothetical protein